MTTVVGTLEIEMAANVARLKTGMDAARNTVSGTMNDIRKSAEMAMRALEAVGIGMTINAFKDWVKGAIDAADALNDLNKATGVSVVNLAGLNLAAKQSGGDLEGVAGSINKLSVNIANDAKRFASIGISAKDPLEAFKQLADVFVSIEDPQLRAAVAAEALGKKWQSAAPMLAEGGARIGEMVEKGKLLSGITPELVAASDKFNDTLAEMEARSKGVAMQMAERLLPTLQTIADAMNNSNRSAGIMSAALDGVAAIFNAIVFIGGTAINVLRTAGAEVKGIYEMMAAIATGGGFDAVKAAFEKTKADVVEITNSQIAFRESFLPKPVDDEMARLISHQTDAMKRNSAAAEANARAFLNSNKEKSAGIDLYAKMIKQADDLVAAIEFDTKTLAMNSTEKETAIALQKLVNLGIKDGTDEYIKYSEAIIAATLDKAQVQSIIDSNKKIAEAEVEAIKKFEDDRLKAEKEHSDDLKDINKQIGQSLSDALMSGSMNAYDFIVNMFKTMILRPLIQPVLTGVVGAVSSGFATAAVGAMSGESGGSIGGSSNLLQTASGLKSVYDVLSGGFTSLGTTVSNYFGMESSAMAMMEATTAAGEASAASMATTASMIGSAATVLGGVAAGIGIGSLISGDKSLIGGSSMYTVGGGVAVGAAIGTAIFPVVGTAIGAVIGGIAGGLANQFGKGPKTTTDYGMSGTLSSSGNTLTQYSEWQKKGGWFSSTSTGEEFAAVDSKVSKYMSNAVAATAIAVKQYANVLGLPAEKIAGFSYDIKMSLDGLTAEEAQKRITEILAGYGNALASVATAEIGPFVRDGEEAGATLTRLATSLSSVNNIFETLNITLLDSSLYGADTASKLADMFGGIDKFIESTNYYYQNFYSQQERAAKTTDQLAGVFGQLGLTLPSTNASFRAMVESARAAGNDGLFAALIKLAPAFNELKTAASMSPVDSTFQTLQTVIQTEQTAALAAIEQQKTIAQASVQVASDSVSALTSIFDYLKGQVSEILQSVDAAQTAAQGVAFIRDALQTAQSTGYLPDQSALSGAVSAARSGLTSSNFSSSYEMRLSQMQLAADLQGLQDIAGDQKTTAEYQLLVAQDQLAALEAQAAITTAYYTSQIAYAQSQVNELKGINSGIMTLAQAMDAFATATGAAGGGNLSSQVSQMYQEILGRGADAQGLSNWLGSGMSLSEIRTGILGSQEAKARGYAVGGAYPGGLALVGESGPELINFSNPGMVYTAAQTKGLLSGGDDTAAEIRALREESRAQAQALVQTQLRMTKLMERWDGSGLPETRVTA